jgi:hypothetical protein
MEWRHHEQQTNASQSITTNTIFSAELITWPHVQISNKSRKKQEVPLSLFSHHDFFFFLSILPPRGARTCEQCLTAYEWWLVTVSTGISASQAATFLELFLFGPVHPEDAPQALSLANFFLILHFFAAFTELRFVCR